MKRNDQDNLRLEAVKSFIDKLDPNTDRSGFVGWAGEIKSRVPLTSDFSIIKNEIEQVQLDAGTNLNLGIQEPIKLLSEGTDLLDLLSDKTKVILFLSDGEGVYARSDLPDSITNIASSLGYKIFSIGLNIDNIKAEEDLKDRLLQQVVNIMLHQ